MLYVVYVVVRVVCVVSVVVAQHHHQIQAVGYCCLVLDALLLNSSWFRSCVWGLEVRTKSKKGVQLGILSSDVYLGTDLW